MGVHGGFMTGAYLIAGLVLVAMALSGSVLKRLPLTGAMLYLALGAILGAGCLGWLRLDPVRDARLMERLTEGVVILSLFSAGLKLRAPLTDGRWRLPVRLALLSMTFTVGLITLVGVHCLGLPLGAAVLLGGVLAPTDPVLASDVQVESARDQDRLRFGLTGEAGLNDGTAFPFVMLGLGLLGLHPLGEGGLRWAGVDVVWSTLGGLSIGALLGTLVGRLVLHLRKHHQEAVGLDDFLALGLIALSYGAALAAHTYGFLAVFAAGLALRRIEREASGSEPPPDVTAAAGNEELATHQEKAPAYMAEAVLGFNEQLERIAEVGVVVLLGTMLVPGRLPAEALWFIPLLFLLIRPVSVALGCWGSQAVTAQRRLVAWFGIRGVGSLYYLAYAITHGLPPELAQRLSSLTLAVVAASVVVHGVSVTPLMRRYRREQRASHRPGRRGEVA